MYGVPVNPSDRTAARASQFGLSRLSQRIIILTLANRPLSVQERVLYESRIAHLPVCDRKSIPSKVVDITSSTAQGRGGSFKNR